MMEAAPPYLFGGDDRGACFSVTCDAESGLLEISVRGRFSLRLSMELYGGLRKCLAEHPTAIIADLAAFDDPYAVSAAMWLSINRTAAAMYPPVRLALALSPTAPLAGRLRRLGAGHFFPAYPDLDQARAALTGTAPLTERLCLSHLPPEPSSVEVASELVDIACDSWRMPELVAPSRAIMSALVGNAVEHAGTDIGAAVWRRGAGLHLSVRDRDPRLPRLLHRQAGEPGHGLHTVDGKSTAWGAMATSDGKMVWATLRTRRQRPF
ncbi:ATP-binding protein [Actinoplanes sp. NPDC048967]|uniref:ATP-binding protein n=1 Tax=Actinoplanes sp. NPDC048967 TaxID=3155269 RepID=UPI0033DE1B72